MSIQLRLVGPRLRLEQAADVLRALAPIVVGRPLALREVERETVSDQNGAGACWRAVWRDGDVELVAGVQNTDGNPRDGYGYAARAVLHGSYQGKPWWRASFDGGGYEPHLDSPILLSLLAVSPTDLDAVRAALATLLPEHRDATFEDAHAVRSLVMDFEQHGHEAWVRDFLARPLVPSLPWVSAALCERKVALCGTDPETAHTWVTHDPSSSRAWQALADAGGAASRSVAEARFLAALTHPFSASALDAALGASSPNAAALASAMAHVFLDPSWRWLDARDRDVFEAHRGAWNAPLARRVTVSRRVRPELGRDAVDAARAVGFRGVPEVTAGPAISGPPLAAKGTLSSACGVGTGWSVRRASLALGTTPAAHHAVAACFTNCEDRLDAYGLVWLGPTRQVVWRTSLSGEPAVAVRTPLVLDVLDTGDGAWGDQAVASLSALRP